jgi:DNA-binding NarL/FixJ family response regulator
MGEPGPIRLVLGDDHALVLDGLRALLANESNVRVLAAASDGERVLDAVRRFLPDVVVLDWQMPYLGGRDCLQQIRHESLLVRVLVLSAFGDGHTLRSAIEAGADGFALKTDPPQVTLQAIHQVAAGQLVFPQAARRWLGPRGDREDPAALTERESEVLELAAQGRSNGQIAAALALSENTVKFHLRNAFAKLGVTNRTEAAAKLRAEGFAKLPRRE